MSSKILSLITALFIAIGTFAQISSGHIIYERKTNLYKKYKDPDIQQYITGNNKTKVDTFELYFNDSLSYFGPKESELREAYSWTTTTNRVYQNLNSEKAYLIKEVWGEDCHMEDSITKRIWKIVPGKRTICGYDCQKAMWNVNDSLNIYAWFCTEFIPSTGPETFTGLPGLILGLATEDGGVIYFAKQVLLERPNMAIFQPARYKGKIYNPDELKAKLEKEQGKNPWGRALIQDLFGIW